jgi:hypothetical protein
MHVSRSRKRSASLMTSPITDDEDFEWVFFVLFMSDLLSLNIDIPRMLASPTKSATPAQRVRFKAAAKPVTPLKGVLKKPEVATPR